MPAPRCPATDPPPWPRSDPAFGPSLPPAAGTRSACPGPAAHSPAQPARSRVASRRAAGSSGSGTSGASRLASPRAMWGTGLVQVPEHHGLGEEPEPELARGSVSVLVDVELGDAAMRSVVVVDLVPVQEPDQVGLAGCLVAVGDVAQPGALVRGALVDLGLDLGEGHDRDVQVPGQRLEPTSDLGHLLDPALGPRDAAPLQVVDGQDLELVLLPPAARGPADLVQRGGAPVDQPDVPAHEFVHPLAQPGPVLVLELAVAHPLGRYPGLERDAALADLHGRLFARDHAYRVAGLGCGE